jgi:hypothetical protein
LWIVASHQNLGDEILVAESLTINQQIICQNL